MSEEKIKVILDCDPGHDDAVAILLLGSSSKFDVLGVTTVRGNQTIEKTTQNAIHVIDYLNLGYKVYQGSSEPILRLSPVCSAVHGASGLDGFLFPEPKIQVEKEGAISFIIRTLLNNDGITFISTGPLTNLALALKVEPRIKSHISRLILMGGAIGEGNVTPAAEFNILTDPEAAKIVFTSGLNLFMVGLDVTRRCLVDEAVIQRMEKIDSRVEKMFTSLMKTFKENQFKTFALPGGPLHDPLTIACLIDSSVLTFTEAYTEIDTSLGPSAGRTNVNISGYQSKAKNSHVATNVDVAKYFDIIEKAIRSYD